MKKNSGIAAIGLASVAGIVAVVLFGSGTTTVNTASVQIGSDTCTRAINDDGSFDIHCPPLPTATATPSPTAPPTTTPPATTVPPTTVPPTTPPPTTTPPVQTNNCFPKPSACGFPDATNTGVPANWQPIQTINGDQSVTTAGAILDGWDIKGCLTVTAPNVTVRNSRINGGCFYAVRNLASNLTLSGDQISCNGTNGTGVTNDKAANNITILRSDISGCENGLNVGGPINMSDSYIHGLTFINNDATHTDGAQFNQGVGPVTFNHNTIDGGPDSNSAIIMWDEGNPQDHDVTISNNILAEAGYTLYCPRMNATNVKILSNRFVPGFYGPSNGCTPGHATWTSNVLDATGAALAAA